MKLKHALATGLFVLAVVFAVQSLPKPAPPEPKPAGKLNLRGKFVGETAALDCVSFGELCKQLAEIIAWDGANDRRLKTGAAFDDLRRTAREFRFDGVSIGARQPQARDAIAAFMTEQLGESGGPASDEQRQRWIETFNDIHAACVDAIGATND